MKSITYVFIGEWTSFNDYIKAERSIRGKYLAANLKGSESERVRWGAISQSGLINKHAASSVPTEPPYDIHFKWYMKNKRRDPDSVYFMAKCILDGFVHARVLPDDGMDEIRSLHHEYDIDLKNPRVLVTIYEVE